MTSNRSVKDQLAQAYSKLNLPNRAGLEKATSAYRGIARAHHPDKKRGRDAADAREFIQAKDALDTIRALETKRPRTGRSPSRSPTPDTPSRSQTPSNSGTPDLQQVSYLVDQLTAIRRDLTKKLSQPTDRNVISVDYKDSFVESTLQHAYDLVTSPDWTLLHFHRHVEEVIANYHDLAATTPCEDEDRSSYLEAARQHSLLLSTITDQRASTATSASLAQSSLQAPELTDTEGEPRARLDAQSPPKQTLT